MISTHSNLIKDLNDQGFPVSEVSDLYNKRYNYKLAIPSLIDALEKEHDPILLEEIVRALSVKWAKPAAAAPLIKKFIHVDDKNGLGLRWVIANALAVVADDTVYDDLVVYLRNKSFGRSREMLVLALSGMKTTCADEELIGLLNDDDLVGHALIALGKRKVNGARDHILRLENHPNSWVRKEAKKALAKLTSNKEASSRDTV